MSKTPVYFFSHGGPNLMYDTEHPAHAELQKLGNEITKTVKPRAVVAVSAHWQADGDGEQEENVVEVNFGEETGLIYDFYGFPAHYYREKYPYRGSQEVASSVASALQAGGIKVKPVSRDIDHGVWVCFKVAFDPASNPLGVPVIQLSLPPDFVSSPETYYRIGRALSPLRATGILLITSGMPVHNLSSLRILSYDLSPLAFTSTFIAALEKGVTAEENKREEAMTALLKREDLRKAHPTLEHLWPVFVGVGAAGNEAGEKIWGLGEGGIGWGFYRWGKVEG